MGKNSLSFSVSVTILAIYLVMIDQVTQTSCNSVSSTSNSDSSDSMPSVLGDRLIGNENTNNNYLKQQDGENRNRVKRMHGYYNGNNGMSKNYKLARAIPVQSDLVDEDDLMFDFNKRYNDYGHMRFGKRGGEGDQFDDYGHMRFGRSLD